jgi:hypothetical protein
MTHYLFSISPIIEEPYFEEFIQQLVFAGLEAIRQLKLLVLPLVLLPMD